MECLENTCYVCLRKENKLIRDINSSLSLHKDIIDIIGYLPFNLGWLKTKRIILICEQCCSRIRETYEFLEMCMKNSALLQGYMELENRDKEAESHVHLNMKQEDTNEGKYEPNSEETEDVFVDFDDNSVVLQGYVDLENSTAISNRDNEPESHADLNVNQEHTNEGKYEANIEETEDVFVDFDDSFVKEENAWKREEVDDNADYSTGNIDKESDSKQVHATNSESNSTTKGPHKCSTCDKLFPSKSELNKHTRSHTGEKLYSCSICNSCFSKKSILTRHMHTHTGEKPYECSTCKKCFNRSSILKRHVRTHSGERPFECASCKKCFASKSTLVTHMRIHSGEKPYECATCKKRFCRKWDLATHVRLHTDVRPYICSSCNKCFNHQSHLVSHMRSHSGVKPYECSTCKKSFTLKSILLCHMRTHTGERPYECATCKKCFLKKYCLARHSRIHTGVNSSARIETVSVNNPV